MVGGGGLACRPVFPLAFFFYFFLAPLRTAQVATSPPPWTFSTPLPLCLVPQKHEISPSYKHDWTLEQAGRRRPAAMFPAAV